MQLSLDLSFVYVKPKGLPKPRRDVTVKTIQVHKMQKDWNSGYPYIILASNLCKTGAIAEWQNKFMEIKKKPFKVINNNGFNLNCYWWQPTGEFY